MTRWGMIVFLMIAFGAAVPAYCGELVVPEENGWINWTSRTIHATGIGVSDTADASRSREQAFMKARRNAYRNLLGIVNAMHMNSGMTVRQYVTDKDDILSRIEQLLNNARIENTRYQSEGTVEIRKMMPMTGAFSQLILPENIVQLEMKKLGRETPDTERIVYTGLVIDARGVKVFPALCFKIVDEKHQEVYGPAYASREFAVQKGICEYRTDIGDIATSERVGNKPLVVRGLRTVDPDGADIVISNTDASRLRGTVDHLFFLRECQVLVIVDPPAEKGMDTK